MNPWKILENVSDLQTVCIENELAKENQAGAVVGGGAALAAGVALGAAALGPMAIPLIMVGGAIAGAKGESTVKNVGKGISKGITGFFDFFKSDEDFFNRGIEKLESGDYGAAIEDFTKAIELNSQNAHAYFVRGCILDEQHNYPEAISDYTQTIQIDPS
jgi:tetratricopeptide (TPR) repeat protein